MKYIFGSVEKDGNFLETLKIISTSPTQLRGFLEYVQEYPDCIITDRFNVLEKYRSDTDVAGNCYDWYFISDHYRYIDKTPRIKSTLGEQLLDCYELQADHEFRICNLELGI